MSLQINDNSGELNGLAVNTDHEALVALTGDVAKSGFTALASEKGVYPNGDRLIKELECSEDYRLRTEQDGMWLADYPLGTAINSRKWKSVLTTQTITVGGARYELNASGITTVSTGSMLQSWRQIPFYKANATYVEFALNWTAEPVANWFAEWGLGNPTTAIAAHTDGVFFRITAGQFRGVCVNNSVETYVDLGDVPDVASVHDFVIEATMGAVNFWHESVLLGTVVVPATQFGPTAQSALPVFVRTYNAAIAPASPIKLQVSAISASNGGSDLNRLWDFVQAGQGNMSIQAPTGTAVAQTANMVNSTGPVSATLANATAGYVFLGGQFQFAAVAGAETDYVIYAYQVPVGQTLTIRGIKIDTFNTGAAVATTATVLQWSLGVGASAVTLLTADGAATKATHRMFLGIQAFAIGDAIGKVANTVDFLDMSPKTVNGGEYVHIILKMPLGTATASQIIRGGVAIDGFWE